MNDHQGPKTTNDSRGKLKLTLVAFLLICQVETDIFLVMMRRVLGNGPNENHRWAGCLWIVYETSFDLFEGWSVCFRFRWWWCSGGLSV